MILGHSLDHRMKRNNSCGRDNSGLAHSTTENLEDPPRLGNEFRTTALICVSMRLRTEESLGPAWTMSQHRREIAHRAARHQHRRLLAHYRRGNPLELVDCGILAVDVIAERRARDRLTHLIGGQRN